MTVGLLEVRLHAPVLDAVVVRVSGVLDAVSAPLLAERVGQQLARAPHVVVDLHEVGFLSPCCLWVLRALHRQAAAVGTQLHLVAEHDAVRPQLRSSGLDQEIRTHPSAELVVAGLAPGKGSESATGLAGLAGP